jgi:hypothetical protein
LGNWASAGRGAGDWGAGDWGAGNGRHWHPAKWLGLLWSWSLKCRGKLRRVLWNVEGLLRQSRSGLPLGLGRGSLWTRRSLRLGRRGLA